MTVNKEAKEWINAHKLQEIECLVPDIAGNARGKFIPADKFIKESIRMPEGILTQSITGEFPNDYLELIETLDGDMHLRPDMSTVRILPWSKPAAQLIHDCYTGEGKAHPLSSRNILKHILDLYEKKGMEPILAPEMEFYLVQRNTDSREVLLPPVGRSGRFETARQSYSIDATNEFKPFIDTLYECGRTMNLDIDMLIHESGAAQFEINFMHGSALQMADQVFSFKRMVREVALQHGMHATFMAKPMSDEPGSAKHIHQSIISIKNGNNLFATKDEKYSADFYHYLGGLQAYSPACMSFYAPNVNSYRRFSAAESSPINLLWGYDNRTTGFRVPDASPDNYRIENRCPGADVNPYLSFAATLASGYLGMQHKIKPTDAFEGNAYNSDGTFPRSLPEALDALEGSKPIKELFGEKFISVYTAVKNLECEQFNQIITSWEREHLLLRV